MGTRLTSNICIQVFLVIYKSCILLCVPTYIHTPTICQPRTCHCWSQWWCCCGYLHHHLPGVLLCWSPAGCPHHLLLGCEEEAEEQWTATLLPLRRPPTCSSVWWGGNRQPGVERECCIWSSGQTGDETESLIWSCAALVSLDCCIDSVEHAHGYFLLAKIVLAF